MEYIKNADSLSIKFKYAYKQIIKNETTDFLQNQDFIEWQNEQYDNVYKIAINNIQSFIENIFKDNHERQSSKNNGSQNKRKILDEIRWNLKENEQTNTLAVNIMYAVLTQKRLFDTINSIINKDTLFDCGGNKGMLTRKDEQLAKTQIWKYRSVFYDSLRNEYKSNDEKPNIICEGIEIRVFDDKNEEIATCIIGNDTEYITCEGIKIAPYSSIDCHDFFSSFILEDAESYVVADDEKAHILLKQVLVRDAGKGSWSGVYTKGDFKLYRQQINKLREEYECKRLIGDIDIGNFRRLIDKLLKTYTGCKTLEEYEKGDWKNVQTPIQLHFNLVDDSFKQKIKNKKVSFCYGACFSICKLSISLKKLWLEKERGLFTIVVDERNNGIVCRQYVNNVKYDENQNKIENKK